MESFLERGVSIDDEYVILESCFDWSRAESKRRRSEAREYFEAYELQLRHLDLEYSRRLGDVWPFAQKSQGHLLRIIDNIRDLGRGATLQQAICAVQADSQLIVERKESLLPPIYAALRAWLLVNFRREEVRSGGGNRPCVEWLEGVTIGTVLNNVFRVSSTELTLAQRRLSPHFTAATMVSICGLKIEWATTLDDHLNLDRQCKTLRIFPYRKWLLLKTEAAVQNEQTRNRLSSAPLPADLYAETSRTLDLLFPAWDRRTQKLLKEKGKNFHSSYSRNRLLDLKHYRFWKDRLLELNEDIFLAPPEGFAQLWSDRRDPQKFWTFWIALAVFILTVASTVASVLQTWATLRATP